MKLKHLLNIVKPLKDEWWLHEALLELNGRLGEYKGTVFPPKLPAEYEEPQGLEFARYAHWEKIGRIPEATQFLNLPTIR
jgi:hypothetical protein